MDDYPISTYTPPTPNLNDTAAAWGPRPSLRRIGFVALVVVIALVVVLARHWLG